MYCRAVQPERMSRRTRAVCAALRQGVRAAATLLVIASFAQAVPLRIASYNVAADINGVTQAPPEIITVLQGVGDDSTYTPARPIDVLGLEETTSNTETVDPIVTALNNVYGAGAYGRST